VTGTLEAVFDNLLVTVPELSSDASREGFRELERLREEAMSDESLFGPARGELRHSADEVAFRPAGVEVDDFYATATFTVPFDATEHRWDIGFAFRAVGEEGAYRLLLVSTGRWYLTIGSGGAVASGLIEGFNTSAGDLNEVELATADDSSYLAVNGDFVAAVDLPERSSASDVWIGTAFFADSFLQGEATPYRQFEVWDLSAAGQPAETETETPTTPEADPDDDRPGLPVPRPRATEQPADRGGDEDLERIAVEMAEVAGSGVTGTATLTPDTGETRVAGRVRGEFDEASIVVQEGTCAALGDPVSPAPHPVNQVGVAIFTIPAELPDLVATPHAVAVYEGDQTPANLVACGDIVAP
jgi:hypothetical protein